MVSRVSCYAVALALLAGWSGADYLQGNQGNGNGGTNGGGYGGNGGGNGGGFNGNGGGNGGGFNGNGGGNGGGFNGNGGGDPIAMIAKAVPGGGVPGQDYPILASVPITGFSCDGQVPGYYADTAPEAGCQVFHICQEGGRIDSFLCPNGTIFNQQYFVCDWWFNFDCSSAEQFFGLNSDIGKISSNGNGGGNGNGNGGGNGYTSNGNGGNGLGNGNGNGNGYSNGNGNGNGFGSSSGNGNGGTSGSYDATGSNGNGGGNGQALSGLYQSPI